MQYLPAVAYQQANQLSHWPSALWHSLVHRTTVMEGWACPGVRCSHRKIHGSQLVGGQISVYQRERALRCALPWASFCLPPLHTHQKPYSILLFLPLFCSCYPGYRRRKPNYRVAGLSDVMKLRQALKALWAQRAECTEMRKDQLLAF